MRQTSIILLTLASLLPACDQMSSGSERRVTGTISVSSPAPFPEGAEVLVELRDVSLQDAPSPLIAQQRITNARSFPVAYRVAFDPARIDARHEYAVSVRIERAGRLLFISDTLTRVLTGGADATADLVVRATAP